MSRTLVSHTAIVARLIGSSGQMRPCPHSVPARTPRAANESRAASWTLPSSSENAPCAVAGDGTSTTMMAATAATTAALPTLRPAQRLRTAQRRRRRNLRRHRVSLLPVNRPLQSPVSPGVGLVLPTGRRHQPTRRHRSFVILLMNITAQKTGSEMFFS